MIKKDNIRIAITLPKTLHEQLKNEAEYQNRTVSNLTVTILQKYMEALNKKREK
ncbi:DNA-binding protein (plasmid) [Clostridium carboxidivorans P7]|uniref:CopG-like ribbon-helix-helix domain-containing protein n=1 Tax=Clostridium carboxidivorans P7 TaxID=536227 RepID=C6PZZ2_9CLOT|nr:DNA-binding protein [Clostridium carboxidivorans]ADO12121.1 hypothetical protein Ccar_4281 [Clostridium carboxidivorans P7]AKN34256.1 DNA-binding protein [Clostridium carboxidivorans P7]EET85202.1 hypothetical protein CcarbDRAFT_4359 [Clostridium carboxidivorans P7]EFG87523.1 hypothetical protein CLCAR_3058 [Clostridium carboxidivorans P7]